MSRRSNVGRGVLVVGAAAAVAGMLSYSPPEGSDREVRAASAAAAEPAPVTTSRPRPKATTTTVRPRPKVTTATTVTTQPPVGSTTVPPTTVAPEAPSADAEPYYPAPSEFAYAPEPQTEDDPSDSTGPARAGTCELFAGLLTVIDDASLRTAVATVGCV